MPGLSEPEPTSGDPAEAGLEAVERGKMWVAPRFHEELQTAGLDRFEAAMRSRLGRCMRALEDRENWRLTLRSPGQAARTVFLKKHHVGVRFSRLRARFRRAAPESAARVEARNARLLAAEGIGVMDLIAWGEHLQADGRLESFLMTDELSGYKPLDRFLLDRFSEAGDRKPGPADRDLLRLIGRVASVARKFHQAGYNHRDLYCCHFFIRESAAEEFDVKLIDLQRVQHRRRFRRRWVVKDLAQLAYSAPRTRIRWSHRVAFMRHYLGSRRIRGGGRWLALKVLLKRRLMEWKLGTGG
jgi:heptose I phosphotransferase